MGAAHLGQEAACTRYPAGAQHQPPASGCSQDLSYTVWNSANKKQKLKLLTEVSGFLPPGHLSALMGPSGSSKTTLLGARRFCCLVPRFLLLTHGAATLIALCVRTAALHASQLVLW